MAHITEQNLERFISCQQTDEERTELLEHIAECTFCARRLADSMRSQDLVDPPPGLREEILKQTVNRKSLFLVAEFLKQKICIRQQELAFYTAKVLFGVGVALFMVFTSGASIEQSVSERLKEYTGIVREYEEPNSKLSDSIRETSSIIGEGVRGWKSFFESVGENRQGKTDRAEQKEDAE